MTTSSTSASATPISHLPSSRSRSSSEAAHNPRNHRYSASKGIPNLRLAAATLYKRKFGVDLDPDTQVLNTIGAKEGLSHLMWVLLEPGDSALVPSPSYPIHIHAPILAGASVTRVPMGADEDLFANLEEAWERAQPKPRVVILSFPHNPTTATVDLGFMERVVGFAREHELLVVHDFAYADLAFDGYEPPSILQVPGAEEVAVELYTLTKSFSMAGWRVGFVVGNAAVVGALARLKSWLDYGTFQPIQIAAIVAMNELPDYPREVSAIYQSRRDALCDGLARRRLDVSQAEGDDVRVGADTGSVPVPRVARLRREARPRGERRGLARHRLRSGRRRVRQVRAGRERAPDRPGRPRHPQAARVSAARRPYRRPAGGVQPSTNQPAVTPEGRAHREP